MKNIKETKSYWREVKKGRRGECGSYRGISLLRIPGKVYGKVIIERVQGLTEEKISEEQRGFRKGRGCVDQIFSFRVVVEKILAKWKKLYAAVMDLEKAYDRVDCRALTWGGAGGGHMPGGGTSKGRHVWPILAALPKIPRQHVGNINLLSVLEKFLQRNCKLFECISERI